MCFSENSDKCNHIQPECLNSVFVRELLPQRNENAHKGDFGRILIVSGSVGCSGAPVLAAKAALRTGAGLIYTCVPDSVYQIVASKLDEPMVLPFPSTAEGTFCKKAIPLLLQRLTSCDACLIGPGIGKCDDTFEIVSELLLHSAVPLILDADALNVLTGHTELLKNATCPVIITPHAGEFARLYPSYSAQHRIEDAFLFCEMYGITVVLKGHHTVICGNGQAFINPTGNPGMAVGGSGDVLSGMVLSFAGQGINVLDAAKAAVWIHGAAGDAAAEELGQYAMTPTDIIDRLHLFLK